MLIADATNHTVTQHVTQYFLYSQYSAILHNSATNLANVSPSCCLVLNSYLLTIGDGFGLKCFVAHVTIFLNVRSVTFLGNANVLINRYVAGPTLFCAGVALLLTLVMILFVAK